MPITYVGGASANGTTATYSVSLTALTGGSGAAAQAGDFVVVAPAAVSTTDRDMAVTTAGYTEHLDLYGNDTRDANLAVATKMLTTAETSVTVNWSGSATNAAGAVLQVWRGVHPVTPLDVTPLGLSAINARIPDPPSITPVTVGAVVIAIGAATTDTTITLSSPAGYENLVRTTSDPGNGLAVAMASKAWTSGAENPATFAGGTASTADSWAAATLVLRPAPEPDITPQTMLRRFASGAWQPEKPLRRYDPDTQSWRRNALLKGWNGAAWVDLQAPTVFVTVTGNPTITPNHTFNSMTGTLYRWTGTGTITPSTPRTLHYLVVAGGGGGGKPMYSQASGAGGGGVLSGSFTATASTYDIAVGAGGLGHSAQSAGDGADGGNSSIVGANAPAAAIGGGGGVQTDIVGRVGGSGSGGGNGQAGGAGTTGQGYAGGSNTGGGGGASQAGANGVTGAAGSGGAGLSSDISGTSLIYGSGGGASPSLGEGSNTPGVGGDGAGSGRAPGRTSGGDAVAGRGGGGGGAGSDDPSTGTYRGGNGGSGVVFIFVPD